MSGVHLDLTHGSDVVNGRIPSFTSPNIWEAVGSCSAEEVAAEFEAQLGLAESLGIPVSHIDNHRPEIYFHPKLFNTVISLAKNRGLYFRYPLANLDQTQLCGVAENRYAHCF